MTSGLLSRGGAIAHASAVALAFVSATAAWAADITVTSAKIQAGKLIITGQTLTAGMNVRLDGQVGSAFNITSSPTKAFTFNIVYHPEDCIVTLQKFTPPSTLGAAINRVVADCGPRGIVPRGAWVTTRAYVLNDVASFQGSVWRAKRSNTNRIPATSPLDWERFVSKGDVGPAGPAGVNGTNGINGTNGTNGTNGAPGATGAAGATGAVGATGPAGPQGSTGVVDTATLGWSSFGSIPASNATPVFLGDPAPLAVTASQQLTGSASASLVMPVGQGLVVFSLCYQRTASSITMFNSQNVTRAVVTTDYDTYATSGSVTPGSAGIYHVGFCAAQPSGANPVSTGEVTGWVMVTNTPPQLCANSVIDVGETCDDGSNLPGDGCSATCEIELGFSCFSQPSVCTVNCGNGVIDVSEQCDDEDTVSGDGCSASCQVEAGFSCVGQPSVCTN